MTLKAKKKNSMLVMVIHVGEDHFTYRIFFVQHSKKKTYHEGTKDSIGLYNDIWRLAPRRELERRTQPDRAFIGQTLRFTYEMEVQYTVTVLRRTFSSIKTLIICGSNDGKIKMFEILEISNCFELFGSTLLRDLLKQTKDVQWTEADKSKTQEIPTRTPKLNPEFEVPGGAENKRL